MTPEVILGAAALVLAWMLHGAQRELAELRRQLQAERERPDSVMTIRAEEVFDLHLADGNVYRASRYILRLTAQHRLKVFMHQRPERDKVVEPGDVWEMTVSPTMLHSPPPQVPRKPRPRTEGDVIPFPKEP